MSLKETTDDYSLSAALQFYQDAIKQQTKNRHSGYHACTVLKMLEKKAILTPNEIDDLRQVNCNTIRDRVKPCLTNLLPSTIQVYANTAKHSIKEFLSKNQHSSHGENEH